MDLALVEMIHFSTGVINNLLLTRLGKCLGTLIPCGNFILLL